MTWLMAILKIYLEKQLLIKYYLIKHLILLKIGEIMAINVDLLQCLRLFHQQISQCTQRKRNNSDVVSDNQQLAEEVHKSIIRKRERRKEYWYFNNNIWGANLADMQLLSKYNKGFRFLFCFIDIYSNVCMGCLTGEKVDDVTKNIETRVPLEYQSNF